MSRHILNSQLAKKWWEKNKLFLKPRFKWYSLALVSKYAYLWWEALPCNDGKKAFCVKNAEK